MPEGCSGERGRTPHYGPCFGTRSIRTTAMPLGIFLKVVPCARSSFPEELDGIKTKKGRPARAIVCHFCLHACLNDDYAYRHLAAIHLNIQWGCGTCHGYVSGYLSKIREHVQSHLKNSSREWSCTHHARRVAVGSLTHPQMGCRAMRTGLQGNWERTKTDDNKESSSSSDEVSPDASDLE